jgi:hypothetical protein
MNMFQKFGLTASADTVDGATKRNNIIEAKNAERFMGGLPEAKEQRDTQKNTDVHGSVRFASRTTEIKIP